MYQTAEAAAVFIALYAAHQVGDHWVQTEHQATVKGEPGWRGRRACLGHVATYTLTAVAALVGLAAACDLAPTWKWGAALGISAVTHYIADRRTPLRKIAAASGHSQFFALGAPRPGHDDNRCLGTGAYHMDQSWHTGWLFVAALVAGS